MSASTLGEEMSEKSSVKGMETGSTTEEVKSAASASIEKKLHMEASFGGVELTLADCQVGDLLAADIKGMYMLDAK